MDQTSENFPTVDPPGAHFDASVGLNEGPGTKIGRYKILELIGEGGFGAVFMAEQEHPVRRRVALKIIKLGLDTKQFVARFEAERQALAMMDHPNVAKVLDGGSTATGRPYFVMELVRGTPITEYCDKNKLNIRNRLELFSQVCQAVQHAHQKGLIHRDLKPSNVLVSTEDDHPRAKVIDFGVAKATQSQLTDKTLFTQFHQMVGTPMYMSPEQADGDLDIDTRSDIYSLGVLLYELLVGATPFDAKELCSNAYPEMQRIIREVEPPTPSTRLSTLRNELPSIAARREIEPAKLKTTLRGELDWIVMRCLEKNRNRRYQSATELSDDIQRYLDDIPVKARPATSTYRLKKFVRRNKPAVIAAGAILLAIFIGLGLAIFGFFRANVERNRAVAALDEVQQQRALADENFREARAAVEDVLRVANEALVDQPGLQPLRLELTKAAIDRYEPFLAKPIADPTPRGELARLYAQYGMLMLEHSEVEDAEVMAAFEKARTIQQQLLLEHPDNRALREDLGWTLILEEWRDHKIPPLPLESGREAIAIFRQLAAEDPTDPFARDDLVWALWRTAVIDGPADTDAFSMADEAATLAEQLVQQYPASVEFRRDLANAAGVSALRRYHANPTPDTARNALPADLRSLELKKTVFADLAANRLEILFPQRPKDSEANIVRPSLMWAQYDVAFVSNSVARIYAAVGDWHHALGMYNQSASVFKSLVQNSPSVATFDGYLVEAFTGQVISAEYLNDRSQAIGRSKDAVAFWNRLIELHPDLPMLQKYAEGAEEQDAKVAKWMAAPTTKP
jgi:serine/threonine protein kinase/tetratricopeptide (TPR) repeat protein